MAQLLPPADRRKTQGSSRSYCGLVLECGRWPALEHLGGQEGPVGLADPCHLGVLVDLEDLCGGRTQHVTAMTDSSRWSVKTAKDGQQVNSECVCVCVFRKAAPPVRVTTTLLGASLKPTADS